MDRKVLTGQNSHPSLYEHVRWAGGYKPRSRGNVEISRSPSYGFTIAKATRCRLQTIKVGNIGELQSSDADWHAKKALRY
jgi:hypothetical protein